MPTRPLIAGPTRTSLDVLYDSQSKPDETSELTGSKEQGESHHQSSVVETGRRGPRVTRSSIFRCVYKHSGSLRSSRICLVIRLLLGEGSTLVGDIKNMCFYKVFSEMSRDVNGCGPMWRVEVGRSRCRRSCVLPTVAWESVQMKVGLEHSDSYINTHTHLNMPSYNIVVFGGEYR